MDVKITVVIPLYQTETHLSEALESALGQTLRELEIICVDDCSTDQSAEIAERYAARDPRVRLIRKTKNEGPGSARNDALKQACGEFISFLDSDDRYADAKTLAVLYETAKRENVSVCGGSWIETARNGIQYRNFIGPKAGFSFSKDGLIHTADYPFVYGFQRFIFNLDFLKVNNIAFPVYRCLEDPVFLVRALGTAEKFYAVSKEVYVYSRNNHARQLDIAKIRDMASGGRDILRWSKKYHLKKLQKQFIFNFFGDFELDGFGRVLLKYKKDNELLTILNEANAAIDRMQPGWKNLTLPPLDRRLLFRLRLATLWRCLCENGFTYTLRRLFQK